MLILSPTSRALSRPRRVWAPENYQATITLSSSYTSCCNAGPPHASCYSDHGDAALVFTGTRPDGTPFTTSVQVGGHFTLDEEFTTDEDVFGRNCSNGSHTRGYRTYIGDGVTIPIGEFQGLLSLASSFGDPYWDQDFAPFHGQTGPIRARSFSVPDEFGYPFCGDGLIMDVQGTITFADAFRQFEITLDGVPQTGSHPPLRYGEAVTVELEPIKQAGVPVDVPLAFPVTIYIDTDEYAPFGSLRRASTGETGDTLAGVPLSEFEAGGITYVYDGASPFQPINDEWIRVSGDIPFEGHAVEGGRLIAVHETWVEMTSTPDTIHTKDASILAGTIVDEFGELVGLDLDRLFMIDAYGSVDPSEVGVLVNDRTGAFDSVYLEATYADLASGQVRYVADPDFTPGPPTLQARSTPTGLRPERLARSAERQRRREGLRRRALERRGTTVAEVRSTNSPGNDRSLLEEDVLVEFDVYTDDFALYGYEDVIVVPEAAELQLAFSKDGAPVDPATYLPSKDDVIEITATLVGGPPDASGSVTFSLPDPYEFEWDGIGGSSPQAVTLQDGTATVSMKSLTWWGVATVQADFDLDGQPLTADQQIPVDSDGDMIADAWEDANGGRSLGGASDDRAYNEETSSGNQNHGDLFTKWQEYQGVLVGNSHRRLKPTRKEVFVDIQNASEGAWAVAEARSQLDIEIIEVAGINTGAEQVAGPTLLKWIGDLQNNRAQGYIHIEDVGAFHSSPTTGQDYHQNGEVVVDGVYSVDGSTAAAQQLGPTAAWGGVTFGQTSYRSFDQTARKVKIYNTIISNLWRAGPPPQTNSIPESVTHHFIFAVAVQQSGANAPDGMQGWRSRYSNMDLNGNGGPAIDLLNPFTLLSSTSTNDTYDDIVTGHSEQEFLRIVTLHELAHALRIAWHDPYQSQNSSCATPNPDYACHPTSGNSVMRSGFGPAKVGLFTSSDISQMKLRP